MYFRHTHSWGTFVFPTTLFKIIVLLFQSFFWGASWRTWRPKVPKRTYLAPKTDQRGAYVGQLGDKMASLGLRWLQCRHFVAKFPHVGAKLVRLGAKYVRFGTSWRHVRLEAPHQKIRNGQHCDFEESCRKNKGSPGMRVSKIHNCLQIQCPSTQLSQNPVVHYATVFKNSVALHNSLQI